MSIWDQPKAKLFIWCSVRVTIYGSVEVHLLVCLLFLFFGKVILLSIFRSSTRPPVSSSICPLAHPFIRLSVHLPICLYAQTSFRVSMWLPVCFPSHGQFVCLSIRLLRRLSVRVIIHLHSRSQFHLFLFLHLLSVCLLIF